jgi:S-adenosylmethionine:tRNA ribosyltransferase-isomerase
MPLDINDFDYKLPKVLIANQPSLKRDNCKLLCLNKKTNQASHHHFYNLVDLLGPNDVLVLNQSKVFPARIFGKKESGGGIELLLIRQLKSNIWLAISKPRPKVGKKIIFDNNLFGEIIKSNETTGQIEIRFNYKNEKFFKILSKIGHTPLPSYINSHQNESQLRAEYQTVFATKVGSAAAPTAGLHFTKNLLSRLKKRGVQIEYITLHVGLGTFQNLRPENIKSKTLHTEFYEIDKNTAKRLNLAKKKGKRIIAVGTTTIRTLESAIRLNGEIKAGDQSTNIFIYPPFKFKFVDCLITNFHLPKSSLLMLVSAFAGKDKIISAYHQAIKNKYRFFSFGDAMFIY